MQQTADTIEFLGVVEAIGQNTITVNGQVIDISSAQVNTPLQVGAAVEVEAIIAPDGQLSAREVNPASFLPNEVEIVGTLQGFDGMNITVSGQVIVIRGAQISAIIPIGSRVIVHASLSPQGTWVAREVNPFMDDQTPAASPEPFAPTQTPNPLAPVQTPEVVPNDDEFEIVGTLQQIGTGFIVVAGLPIGIVDAEINDPLVQGGLVKVHLSVVNGQLVAREVERAGRDDEDFEDDSGRNNDEDSDSEESGGNPGMGMGD